MSHTADPFFQVPRVRRKTSAGEVDLPIAYYDTDQLIVAFGAAPEPVQEALAGAPLSLVTLWGRAIVALVFFEYRDTSIGAYNEVGLATLVVPKGESPPPLGPLDVVRDPRKRKVAFHVLELPVTTPEANAAGRELWGYPKFVTRIDAKLGENTFAGCVRDPENHETRIVTLEGRLPPALPIPPAQLMIISQLEQRLLRTVVDVQGPHHAGLGGGLRLSVGASQHEMAAKLRAFGLDGATPALTVFARGACSLLHLGDPIRG